MLRIAICEDVPQHLATIEALVRKCMIQPITILTFSNAYELLQCAETVQLDLLLSDIDLGIDGPNGIELARQLHNFCPDCQIIFVTGYTQYAVAVYEVEHVYLVTKEDLEFWLPRALQKATSALSRLYDEALTVTRKGKAIRLPQKRILYCERMMRTTHIASTEGEFLSSNSLDVMITQMKSQPFVRCHRSFLVNLHFVKVYQRDEFLLKNDAVVPISRGYAKEVKNAFHKSLSTALR